MYSVLRTVCSYLPRQQGTLRGNDESGDGAVDGMFSRKKTIHIVLESHENMNDHRP